jgi:hypothetical protein
MRRSNVGVVASLRRGRQATALPTNLDQTQGGRGGSFVLVGSRAHYDCL